jgi:DNA-binding transcriptional LysR family regulator
MLTLRQIEVVRAVMVSGSIAGAAKLLNVSAPGISRLVKYTEASLKIKLFQRQSGRFIPTPEAHDIFEQINGVYKKVDDLAFLVGQLQRGASSELRIGSVPSISHVMVPRAVELVRRRYTALHLDINILKIEEAIDYLLLGKGELIAMSRSFSHPSIEFQLLATGKLYCIVPAGHALASRRSISAEEIVRHPLIGIDPNDPYGAIMAEIFLRRGLTYDITIRARFGVTVCALVKAGLGIAVIDQFTVAYGSFPGIRLLAIEEPTPFETYVAVRRGAELSLHADYFITCLRREMENEDMLRSGDGE